MDLLNTEITTIEAHAAWVLAAAFGLSLIYELWRAIAKQGASTHDSLQNFTRRDILVYAMAAIVIASLLVGVLYAAWIALVFTALFIGLSMSYYNPIVLMERKPGAVDWTVNVIYVGLQFIVLALLVYQ